MEGVRLTRWLLSPVPTFKLWRRMKLWELRSYEQVIKLEQDRLIYQARLQARFGRNWRRKAPIESMMPLRLAKYGVPLAETAPAGLAAAGIEPALLPPVEGSRPKAELPYEPQREPGQEQAQQHPQHQQQEREHPLSLQKQAPQQQQQQQHHHHHRQPEQPEQTQQPEQAPGAPRAGQQPLPQAVEAPQAPPTHDSPWFAAQKLPETPHPSAYDPQQAEGLEPTPAAVPLGPGRTRPLGDVGTIGAVPQPRRADLREEAGEAPEPVQRQDQQGQQGRPAQQAAVKEPPAVPEEAAQLEPWSQEDEDFANRAFEEYTALTDQEGQYPSLEALDITLADKRDVHHPRSTELLQGLMPQFRSLYTQRTAAGQNA